MLFRVCGGLIGRLGVKLAGRVMVLRLLRGLFRRVMSEGRRWEVGWWGWWRLGVAWGVAMGRAR